MIHLKTESEIALIRASALLVGKTHAAVAALLKPGVTTARLDKVAEEFLADHGARPSFKGYQGFPATLCISINHEVVHGIPGNRELRDGDIVSIDCGAFFNGYHGDSAFTYALGEVEPKFLRLLQVTRKALDIGVSKAIAGNRTGDIGSAIQDFCELKHSYGIVRELVGHGVGKSLHEDPEVPNYGSKGKGIVLKEGLVIAIEPMVNFGKKNIKQLSDGWTIVTADNLPSAHFEHTVAVQKGKPDVLSTFEFIDEAIKNNQELQEISTEF